MKVTRDFVLNGNRYLFDLKYCTISKGFVQVDTQQDASYYGTWANPFKLKIISYAEGDVTICQAETEKEFVNEIRKIKQWNEENGWEFYGIDTALNEKLEKRFNDLNLGDLLH